MVPRLTQDFPTQVCVHVFEVGAPPEGARLPLFVLVTRQNRVVTIEGMPEYEDLRRLIEEIFTLPGETHPPGR